MILKWNMSYINMGFIARTVLNASECVHHIALFSTEVCGEVLAFYMKIYILLIKE